MKTRTSRLVSVPLVVALLVGALLVGTPCVAFADDTTEDLFFDAAGVLLRYTDQGIGDPIVLVHGSNVGPQVWLKVAPLLQERAHEVVTPTYFLAPSSCTSEGWCLGSAGTDAQNANVPTIELCSNEIMY